MAKSGSKKVVRSAVTGRFVKPVMAKLQPQKTVTETVKVKKKK